ncbi:MAG: AAA family ATPase [Acidobacteriota bacterium]
MESAELSAVTAIDPDPQTPPSAVRLHRSDLAQLGLELGDAVEVETESHRIAARVFPATEPATRRSVVLPAAVLERLGIDAGSRAAVRAVKLEAASRVELSAGPPRVPLANWRAALDGTIARRGDRLTIEGGHTVQVTEVRPRGWVLIDPATEVVLHDGSDAVSGRGSTSRGFEDIGGLGPQLAQIRELVEAPLRHIEVFRWLGIEPPKGILLHGPPGCGKTLIARTLARESGASFFHVAGPEIVHKFYGESEAALRRVFEQAEKEQPSLVFLDEIDAIAPRRDKVQGDVERRIVAQLLTLLDGLEQRQGVLVLAATNLPDMLDPALRRPGRLDREIVIPVPDRIGRQQILAVHSRDMPLDADVDLEQLARRTHGFVGADLQALCREAAMARLRRHRSSGLALSDGHRQSLKVDSEAFEEALLAVRPSALRELFVEIPEVPMDRVGGLDEVKELLRQAVEWPLEHPELLRRAGLRPTRGVLLAGPPGVGKTLLAKALATEAGVSFLSVQGMQLLSRFVGESEAAVHEVFAVARRAAPTILFFDEIDALVAKRSTETAGDGGVAARVLTQFLTELDGVDELRGVVVLAATNRLDRLDPAVIRPGRFDQIVELELPDLAARRSIFEVHLRDRPLSFTPDLDDLAEKSGGFSGADIAELCRRAALQAVGRAVAEAADQPRLALSDLETAWVEVQASLSRGESA